jgi:hypothetical protein
MRKLTITTILLLTIFFHVSSQFSSLVAQQIITPDKIELAGAHKNFSFTTPFGELRLRWKVTSDNPFGTNPYQIVKETWIAAGKVVSRSTFPTWLRSSKYQWNMIFMDQDTTARSNPFNSINCHPAWITPPANIYVSSYLISTSCGREKLNTNVARDRLKSTLMHEFGHALEYQLLGESIAYAQRFHSEGFAEWFETEANLQLSGNSNEKRLKLANAKVLFDLSWDPLSFNSSPEDYLKSFAMMTAIIDKFGLSKIIKAYDNAREMKTDLLVQLFKETNINMGQWKKITIMSLN